jgi:hypothetical protein
VLPDVCNYVCCAGCGLLYLCVSSVLAACTATMCIKCAGCVCSDHFYKLCQQRELQPCVLSGAGCVHLLQGVVYGVRTDETVAHPALINR